MPPLDSDSSTALPAPLRGAAELSVLDITEFFGRTSGGIRTYLLEKARYVEEREHLSQVLVVPGARDEILEAGLDPSNGLASILSGAEKLGGEKGKAIADAVEQGLKEGPELAMVDDSKGITLASASTMEADLRSLEGDQTAKSKRVGELVAERAKAAGVESVVFDRAGHKYHGRVAALADGAREGGLAF